MLLLLPWSPDEALPRPSKRPEELYYSIGAIYTGIIFNFANNRRCLVPMSVTIKLGRYGLE